MRGLDGVVVADHVIGEDDVTLLGETDAECLGRRKMSSFSRRPYGPMAVRIDDAGMFGGGVEGAIKIAAEIVAWQGFEEHFFDGVAVALETAEDFGVGRAALGHGIQAGGRKDLFAQLKALRFSQSCRLWNSGSLAWVSVLGVLVLRLSCVGIWAAEEGGREQQC